MKILYIGEPQTHENYLKGIVPSHWLYGACEMEQEGHNIIWEKEEKAWANDISLVKKYNPDMIFIPNLNIRNHLFLLLLSALGICRKPIYAYLHHGARSNNNTKSFLYRLLLSGVKHLFFLSEKSMEETIQAGWISKERCSLPGWGADMNFFQKVPVADGDYYISTGKENRDFDTLIEAFRQTGASLKIITAKSHGGRCYEDLTAKTKDIPNIEVTITENTGDVYPLMLRAMAGAKALVCPLNKDCLTYCVGLSTIADAEGLGKSLIITNNPYHEKNRTQPFHVAETVEDWIKAIQQLEQNNDRKQKPSSYSMQQAYEQIKKVMFGQFR